jgi:hypothetical protein
VLRLPFGRSDFLVMDAEEIDAIRKQYSKQWKQGALPAWYAKKCVVRQSVKLIPTSARLADALRVVEQDAEEEGLDGSALPMLPSRVDEDDTPRAALAAPLPDVPAEPRRGPYEEQASLDGNHAIDKGVRRPVSRTVVAAPVEGAARVHPALTESDPYDAAPVLSEEELDRLTQEQDERSARAGR